MTTRSLIPRPRNYSGQSIWWYRLDVGRGIIGTIKIGVPTLSYKKDEEFAKSLIRKKYGYKRLPKNTIIHPF